MDDKDAILKAAADYIEGWYYGNPERMERALSIQLAKRRIAPDGEIWEVNKEWMVEATRDGRGKLDQPENGMKEMTLLDKTTTMGSVKIVSEKFIDYVHLAKDSYKWVIVNVLWDFKE